MPQSFVHQSSRGETQSRVPSLVRQIVPAALLMTAAFAGLMLDAAGGEPDRDAGRPTPHANVAAPVSSTFVRLDLAGLEPSAFADNTR